MPASDQADRLLVAALSAALVREGRAAQEHDSRVVAERGELPLLVVLSPRRMPSMRRQCCKLAVYTLIPVLPVALATMPLAELSARLLMFVF